MSTDKLQTVLGVAKGVLVAAIDYVVHLDAGSVNWKAPTFWAGMGVAVVEAVKGYYAAGVKPE